MEDEQKIVSLYLAMYESLNKLDNARLKAAEACEATTEAVLKSGDIPEAYRLASRGRELFVSQFSDSLYKKCWELHFNKRAK